MKDNGGYYLKTDKFKYYWKEKTGELTARRSPYNTEGNRRDRFVLGQGRELTYEDFKKICEDWEA